MPAPRQRINGWLIVREQTEANMTPPLSQEDQRGTRRQPMNCAHRREATLTPRKTSFSKQKIEAEGGR